MDLGMQSTVDSFLTLPLDAGELSGSRTYFIRKKRVPMYFGENAGWAAEPVRNFYGRENVIPLCLRSRL